jgi:hypothetical protein
LGSEAKNAVSGSKSKEGAEIAPKQTVDYRQIPMINPTASSNETQNRGE